ncbi:hypothetical protein [Novosphingobium olei]|uniref:Uncharacterized protein n=1 Tax=Novosphingobium olei TaxID=2728851 RepID=A0A7Y0BQR6_9SPHN|nr:hypothetical protein [Novosphingobium olei]NML94784.1 hypothetical protein [Novosphingobium olei]
MPVLRTSLLQTSVAVLLAGTMLAGCSGGSPEVAPSAEPSALASIDAAPSATPAPVATAGDGDGQGDAKVAGTDYNATAEIPCGGGKTCKAGVNRQAETGPYIDVTKPDGRPRTLFFARDGKFLSINSAQADGSAGFKVSSRKDGDTTIIDAGPEHYEVPDAFLLGD